MKLSSVLIIDESLSNQNTIKSFLIGDYKILTSSNVEEAEFLIGEVSNKISLIIINLNVNNAYNFLSNVKKTNTNLKVIVLSAFSLTQKDITKLNADGFIQEPFMSNELTEKVNSLIKSEKITNDIEALDTPDNKNIDVDHIDFGYMELKLVSKFNKPNDFTIEYINDEGLKILNLNNLVDNSLLKYSNGNANLIENLIKVSINNISYKEEIVINNIKLIATAKKIKTGICSLSFLNIANNNLTSYKEIIELAGIVAFEYDVKNNSFKSSENFKSYLFYSSNKNSIFDKNFSNTGIHLHDIDIFNEEFTDKIRSGYNYATSTIRLKMIDGSFKWNKISCTIFRDNENKITKVIGIIKNVDEEIKHKERIKFLSMFDPLTNIYNKEFFISETAKVLKEYIDLDYYIIRIDISKLKIINELFTIAEGDRLLRHIANILLKLYYNKPEITYGRFGSDLFYICLHGSKDDVLSNIEAIDKMIGSFDINFEVLTYFGIYHIVDRMASIESMCDKATLAVNTIKNNYITHYAFFDNSLQDELIFEQTIINDMNQAIVNDEFLVYLQPKFDMESNEIVGSEALVRWNHHSKGLISPNLFIPIFERNGFILTLDLYMIDKSCAIIKNWLNKGLVVHPISCNLSKIDLYNPQLVNLIVNTCDKYSIPHHLLELEITETAFTDNPNLVQEFVNRIQSHGFKVLMDDFGSGYSSLNLLKDIKFDILKIDLNFLKKTNDLQRAGTILSSVIRMARVLKTPCIIEGIEEENQSNFLRSIGCSIGQGFLYSKPVPLIEYEELLKYNKNTVSNISKNNIDISFVLNLDEFAVQDYIKDMFSAFGIYEYNNGHVEAIQLSDSYFEMIKQKRSDFYLTDNNILNEIADEYVDTVKNMLLSAYENKISTVLYKRKLTNGSYIWLYSICKLLNGTKENGIYYVIMNDVTKIKESN